MPPRRCLSVLRLAIFCAIVYAIYDYRQWWKQWVPKDLDNAIPGPTISRNGPDVEEPWNVDYGSTLYDPSEPCARIPGAERVLLLVLTSATEIYQNLPAHLVTTFRCAPNVMIFSDLEQTFADYPVYDALASVPEKLRAEHSDFELYRKIQKYQHEGNDVTGMDGIGSSNLDKWMYLPTLQMASAAAREDIDWFVIIGPDTSMSWTNLLKFLARRDPQKPYYAGSELRRDDVTFASAGGGIIISRATAKLVSKQRHRKGKSTYDRKWESVTEATCCGDQIIGQAIASAGVLLAPTWPLLQGQSTSSLDWAASLFCTPSISWRTTSASELNALWQFEAAWIERNGPDSPYLFRDVFDTFIADHLATNRTKWNNFSRDRSFVDPSTAPGQNEAFEKLQEHEKAAVYSADACEAACVYVGAKECVQWLFAPGRCHLGASVQLGKADSREEIEWTSGWLLDRIAKIQDAAGDCEAKWPV